MEDIYTIKVRTNPDSRDLYPSERRYSASTVLGLSVVHLALALTALLLASLSLSHHNPLIQNNLTSTSTSSGLPVRYQNFTNFNEETNSSNYATKNSSRRSVERDFRNDDMAYLDEDVDVSEGEAAPEDSVMKNPPEDTFILQDNSFDMEDLYTPLISLIISPCFMALGALLSGTAGILAWKRWYIDHNIKWFFFMSSISTITSLTCLTITALTLGIVTEQQNHATSFSNGLQNGNAFIFSFSDNNVFVDRLQQSSPNMPQIKPAQTNNKTTPNIRMVIAINLLIASVLEFIWSILSTRISWKGMRNSYPDDIILSRGKMETNTIHKGNKKHKLIAPDILNHHPKKKKFAKYFPKKQDDFLPKPESNKEYRERVDKFLAANIHEPDN